MQHRRPARVHGAPAARETAGAGGEAGARSVSRGSCDRSRFGSPRRVTEIAAELERLRVRGLYRRMRTVQGAQGPWVTVDGRKVLLLCSNDYLGLAGDPLVRAAAAEAAERWGAGAGASRLV